MKIKSVTGFVLSLVLILWPVLAYSYPLGIEEKKIPIIMYHNVHNKKSILGKFVITPDELEADLAYLKEAGYETVVMADLIAFVEEGVVLPEKPVVLTFDDGDYAVYKYLLPLLERYDMKAVVSIVGSVTDKYSDREPEENGHFPNLTWEQVNGLLDSGRVEIQNHTYDLHKEIGAKKRRGETEDAYKIRLLEDLEKLQSRMEEMTGRRADTLTYPFGMKSASSDIIVKDAGFKGSLGCEEKINTVTIGDESCLFSLGRYLRPHGVSSNDFFEKFSDSYKNY